MTRRECISSLMMALSIAGCGARTAARPFVPPQASPREAAESHLDAAGRASAIWPRYSSTRRCTSVATSRTLAP